MESETVNSRWRGLYKLGGVAALIIAVFLVGEVIVYAVLPRASTTLEQFTQFQNNWLFGLLTFDLLGMISYLFFIPMILALYMVLRRHSEAIMIVGTVLFFVGIAEFFATNTSFSMLDLSHRYAAATTDAERAMFLAAGQSMLTQFNENAFLVSYVIVSAAWLMISVIMLRSNTFSRLTAWAGILTGAAAIIAVILEHVSTMQVILNISIAFYFAAIVFLLIWVILAGRRLLKLGAAENSLAK